MDKIDIKARADKLEGLIKNMKADVEEYEWILEMLRKREAETS